MPELVILLRMRWLESHQHKVLEVVKEGYTQLKTGNTNNYTTQSKFSTFFSSSWSATKIIQEMTTAFNNKVFYGANPNNTPSTAHWEGLASNGMKILFVLTDVNDATSEVITAYPIY